MSLNQRGPRPVVACRVPAYPRGAGMGVAAAAGALAVAAVLAGCGPSKTSCHVANPGSGTVQTAPSGSGQVAAPESNNILVAPAPVGSGMPQDPNPAGGQAAPFMEHPQPKPTH